MPKRKRAESVTNLCDGLLNNDGECDAIVAIEEEISATIDAQTNACLDTTISLDTTNECESALVNASSDCGKSRRKSNRISKPIQRSLDLSPNQTVNTIKKIAKQNHISSGINCDADKTIIKSKNDELSTTAPCSSKAKSSRKWEMWTEDDTKWFFEAICEHGKDFTNIQSYILQRCEKKGINQDLIKNKEQVRHYYYRTWHKIANSLNISNVVDKATQELYALINYGEIWKKFGSKFDNKLTHHLPHLVNFGHTIFKVKGKSVRIKTPICRALKKIHNINVPEKTKSNNQSLLNLPKEVCVELHPANNEAWLRVHCLSQNPRIRASLSLQKRVSTLVEYLEKRWNQSRIRDSECRILCGTSLPNASQVEESCHLRVRPHISGNLNTVLLTKPVYNSQTDLSLSAYLKKLYNQELKSKIKKTKTAKSKDKTSDDVKDSKPVNDTQTDTSSINEDHKRLNLSNSGTKLENENFKSDEEEPIAEAERSLSLLKMLAEMNEAQHEAENHVTDDDEDDANKEDEERDEVPSPESCAIRLPEPPANATLAQWLSGKDEEENDHQEYEKKEIYSNSDLPVNNDKMCLSADRAKKGWSLKETGSMTFGELYLLFRCPQKIVLEYLWEPIVADDETVSYTSTRDINSDLDAIKDKIQNQDLLTKLLFAANLALMNLKKKHTNSVTQTQKKKRIKPTPVSTNEQQMPSQLLSSVISNTIFNDNSDNSKTNIMRDNISRDLTESHNFIVPTSPAPKAVSKTKSRTVCGDPALIQEALRQLQSTKYTRRQRRPTPKPVFGHQNKPLLPRGSPSITSTATSTVSSSQPIYMIPSRPLHINAIATVSSHSGASIASSLLSQSLPVSANVKMTAINANQLSNTLQNSIRQTLNSHSNNDLFDVLLPQQKTQTRCDTTTNVNTLIKTINTSNLPIIQNVAQLLEPISSVAVPLINPSLPTLQHLQAANSSASITENAAVICSTSDTMSSIMTSQNRNIESRKLIDNNNDVILCKNGETNSSDSSDRLLSSTHNISSLLEISLPEPPFSENSCSGLGDSFEIEKRPFEKLSHSITDTTMTRMPHTASNNDPTLPTSSASLSSLLSPPIERHKSNSPIADTQWLNGESCDISIGTLLNACESPCKTVSVSNNSLANDVDTQMSCLATDNSIDLMAKFADLAAQIVDSNSKST